MAPILFTSNGSALVLDICPAQSVWAPKAESRFTMMKLAIGFALLGFGLPCFAGASEVPPHDKETVDQLVKALKAGDRTKIAPFGQRRRTISGSMKSPERFTTPLGRVARV
jgi:hypothetical protein